MKGTFNSIKRDLQDSVMKAIDESIPFEVETDASEVAILAVLTQKGVACCVLL